MSDITGFPLSPQQAQWWLYRESRQTPTYLQVVTHQVLDMSALRERLAQQLASEEILRTRLQRIAGMEYPLQVIDETSDIAVTEKDWRTLPAEKVAQHLDALSATPTERLRVSWITLPETDSQPNFLLHLSAPSWMLDPMSLQLLAERLLGLTEAPPEPLQYVDFSQWKQEVLETEQSHPGLAYWQEQVISSSPSIGLETHQKSDLPAKLPVRLPFSLSATLVSTLGRASTRHDLPLPRLLQGAWHSLLTRLAQPGEMPIAWYEDGRNDDTFDALGLYGQTLACRHAMRIDQALTPQLKPFSDTLSLATGWQDYIAGLQSEQPMPVFAWFAESEVLQHSEFERYDCGGVCAPLSLQLTCFSRTNGELNCQLLADPARYEAQALICLAEQWQQLLTAIASGSDSSLGRIPLLGEQQRQRLAPVFAGDLGLPPTFLQLWRQAVERYPDRIAVSGHDTRLTYRELNERSNQLARYLCCQGVSKGDTVAIHLPRGVDAIIAILATFKAGAAYLPLDPDYPEERQQSMVRDSRTVYMIGHNPAFAPVGVRYLSPNDGSVLSQNTTDLELTFEREDTAYLIYTSGSLGQPKAVEISHNNLSHSLTARHRYYVEPVGAYLMLSSLSFDSSVAGIFWTLSQGGELVLPANGDERDTQILLELMCRHGITHGLSLPAVYDALIGGANPAQRASLQKSLAIWIVAGEACPDSLVEKHHRQFPDATLVNEYGPTEATVWATAATLKTGEPVTIGRPIPGMGLYLINEYGQAVAIGEIGEIYLSGPQLAKGYLGQPNQTEKAFVKFPSIAGEQRLYRSGDLARWRANGDLQFLGRKDRQVKIRGHRIELGEIESRLGQHASVQQAAVVPRDTGNSQRLVAYITASGDTIDSDIDTSVLREHLACRLPDYMVPTDFVVMQRFPLTPNGKLDTKALPEPERKVGPSYIAPRGDVEQALATIIGELLDRERVGIHDNFFQIGGDSILSLQVVSRALSKGLSVSAQDIFEQKTIAKLAPKVVAAKDVVSESISEDTPLVTLDDSELDALLDEVDNASS